ncbi:MAG: nucleotidyl transferase AbiEii/AbiGii toxin family protein [Chitinophagales bacterium]|nr:nucleotidyl transferase AbiEii/AbiGii toxin family protein [Chitinophagales bacterium]
MLYKETVYPKTFELLKRIQSIEKLNNFYLAGGTALSLYYGHRISIDLDFFTHTNFNTEEVILALNNAFINDDITIINEDTNSILLSINNVKIDILAHQYPLVVTNNNVNDNIRIYAKEDIIAMKLNALANRGTKKDFFDIYEVLQEFSLQEILDFFKKKYPNKDYYYILRSLAYFNDAELNKEPMMIKKYTWSDVKNFISNQVRNFE